MPLTLSLSPGPTALMRRILTIDVTEIVDGRTTQATGIYLLLLMMLLHT